MTKEIDIKTKETIENRENDKQIEYLKPETLDVPDYRYWWSEEPLDASYQVRNINWWWKVKTWFSSIASWYTDVAITWVWFKPKAIQVVVHSSNKVAWGYADNVWWTLTQRCIYADWWAYSNQSTRLFRFSSTEVWDLVSFDSDWFTVKSDLAATMIWTCFW